MPLQTLESLMTDAVAAIGATARHIGSHSDVQPRFELFNGANSICSQKVRTVLAHHGMPYRSHTMNMFIGQTYLPAYVRLRMVGCDALGGVLMDRHSGSTSVSTGGCDAAVVPTLVDWETRQVLVDSKRICLYLDAIAEPATQLRPDHLAARIDAELEIVDNLPNYQMLSGKPPGEDRRPDAMKGKTGVAFAMSKVARCDQYLAQHADDEALVRGYRAKRAKELNAAEQLFTDEAMRSVYGKAEAACDSLEQTLAQRAGRWLLDDRITMADLYWAVELLRMQNMGADRFWAGSVRPAVAEFAEQTGRIDAVRSSVVDWPGATF
jgi:2,5-dichlorohydroquinone reductive dechlorinase